MPTFSGETFRRPLLPLDSSCVSLMQVLKVTWMLRLRPLYDSGPTLSLLETTYFSLIDVSKIVALSAPLRAHSLCIWLICGKGGLVSYSTSLVEVYRSQRNGLSGGLGCKRGRKKVSGDNCHPIRNEFRRQRRQAIIMSHGRTILDG